MFGGVFIQAVVRGKTSQEKDWDDSGGIGILTMYDDVVKVARLTENQRSDFRKQAFDTDDYSEVLLKHLKNSIPRFRRKSGIVFMKKCGAFVLLSDKRPRIWKESYKLYRKFYAEAKRRMNPECGCSKYIYCTETPFCEKDASFAKRKRKGESK